MTDVVDVSSAADGPAVDAVDEQLLRQLSDRARAEGLRLTGGDRAVALVVPGDGSARPQLAPAYSLSSAGS